MVLGSKCEGGCQIPPSNPPPPLCDIPSGCCCFMGPWTVTRSSLRMLRRVAAFCRPLRPVLLLVSFLRLRSPVVGVPGLCWMWRDVPFARQRRPGVGVLGVVLVVAGVVRLFLLSTHLRPQAVHNLPRCVSVCVRPRCPVPPALSAPPPPPEKKSLSRGEGVGGPSRSKPKRIWGTIFGSQNDAFTRGDPSNFMTRGVPRAYPQNGGVRRSRLFSI